MTRHRATKTKSIFKFDRFIIYNLCFNVRNKIPRIELHLLSTKSIYSQNQKKLEALFSYWNKLEGVITSSKCLTLGVN